MKLCKDCKWCELEPSGDTVFATCLSPKNTQGDVDPVDGGKPQVRYVYCHIHREDNDDKTACQLKARWFEPKETPATTAGEGDTKK